jgi:tetratricopeptide (TPR) repeat protein
VIVRKGLGSCSSYVVLLIPALLLSACRPAEEATRVPATKESLLREGRILAGLGDLDSARAVFNTAYDIDSTSLPAALELAAVCFDLGKKGPSGAASTSSALRESKRFYARATELGDNDALTYDRLCEICVTLDDDRGFLKYARRNAELFPYDRQYYNLGLAYFGVNDFQAVVKSQKEALEKFKESPYVGGFHRQLGRAYLKMDRDQTAERTFVAGVKAVDERLALLATGGAASPGTEGNKRLEEDRVNMLLHLKQLHTIYKDQEKLRKVEQRLNALGK